MSIGIWIVLGLLVVCCVMPMLRKGRHGKNASGEHGKDTGPQNP
jgi:hypothetical protein